MIKKRFLLFATFFLIFSACSGQKAKELYETAQFEELQRNHKHAIQLYDEILRDHPESEYAEKAKSQLKKLKPNTP